MTYIYFEFDEILYWIEVDNQGYAQRQIIKKEGEYSLSCRTDCLAEGIVDIENDCEKITLKAFNMVWYEQSLVIQKIWEQEKKKYLIGTSIIGTIKYFYPQGIIFDIGNIQGCGDYLSCKENSNANALYPSHSITGIVKGYDEVNRWILINECQAL